MGVSEVIFEKADGVNSVLDFRPERHIIGVGYSPFHQATNAQGLVAMKIKIPSLHLLLLVFTTVFSIHSFGEIYKWIDENGNAHYGDKLPENTKSVEISGEVNTVDNQTYDFLPASAPQPAVGPAVVMYATNWCPYCRKARDYFKSEGIEYTEYDIENNPSAKQRYDSLGGKGVPLILVGEKQLAGFSVQRFEQLYP